MDNNDRELRYGPNVEWFLHEISTVEMSDIDSGEFEIYGEDEAGREASSYIDITELAADALQIIVNLRKQRDAYAAVTKTAESREKLTAIRAEGIHFAANRILAAWTSGFIKATPSQVADVSGAVLSALEFLPNATAEELTRDYADKARADIAAMFDQHHDARANPHVAVEAPEVEITGRLAEDAE